MRDQPRFRPALSIANIPEAGGPPFRSHPSQRPQLTVSTPPRGFAPVTELSHTALENARMKIESSIIPNRVGVTAYRWAHLYRE